MGSLREKNVTKIENTYVAQQEQKAAKVQKRKLGLKRRLTLYAVTALLFTIIAVATLISQNSILHEKNAQMEKAEKQLAQMKSDEKSLKAEIVKLNDDEYLAKLVRRDYFLSEEGEIIFTLPKDKEDRD
jgi:cell division protein DivIC